MSEVTSNKPPFATLWLRAMRVPFLQATFIPVILGSVIAWQITGWFNWGLFLLTLLGASLIQVSTNMFNDYFDFKSGNDLQVRHKNPFAGGGRILTAGLINPSTHFLVSASCLVIGSLIGLYFIYAFGLTLLFWLGLIGVVSSYFYVAPPFRFAYRGVGEFIVGLNFGPIMTLGAYYVQTGNVSIVPILASIPIGLLIVAVLWINEFPDMDADRAVGKRTLVLRLGHSKSITAYVGMVVLAYLLVVVYSLARLTTAVTITSFPTLGVLLTVPLSLRAIKGLRANYGDPHAIIPSNAGTVMLHLGFGVLSILGFAVGALTGL